MAGITQGEFWLAMLGGGFVLFASITGVMYLFHRQNKDREERRIEAQEKRNIQFDTVIANHPLHSHGDMGGDETQLTKGNIRYAKHSA